MKSYFQFLKSYHKEFPKLKKFVFLILFVFFLQVVLTLSFQISYKEIFDAAGQRKNFLTLLNWIYIILAASLLRIGSGILADYMVGLHVFRIFSSLRNKLFQHLQWLPIHFYQNIRIGDLVSRYSNNLQQMEIVTRQFLPNIVRSLLLGLLSVITLFYFEWRLALFTLALFPFVVLGARLFSRQAAEATRINQRSQAELSNMLEEVTTQHILVQSFNLQESFSRRFQKKMAAHKYDFMRGIFARSVVSRTSIFGLSISEILVFSVGAIMTYHNYMTPGTLFGFFALVWNLSGVVNAIAQYMPSFIEASASAERIEVLFNEKSEASTSSFQQKQHTFSHDITFENVSLDFDNKCILKEISFKILAGQSVALVGPTGSGKSTLLSLIMAFHYPNSGIVKIDGIDIHELDKARLRDQIGMVLQNNPLFNTTIGDNIRMGCKSASDAQIVAAAKAAEIHDFIISLPEGYASKVLEYGSNLSGGQKQRIAIARAYLRNPKLILLDEPTSALDPVAEKQINALIEKLSEEKTVILSTHRLASVQQMDCIYVLDHGRLIEKGTHGELMRSNGLYYQMWQKQNGMTLDALGRSATINIGYLKKIPFLRDLPEELLKELAETFLVEWVDEGTTIFEKGSAGDLFYVIARGKVEVLNPDRPSPLVATLEEGDYFGEIALMHDVVRTATIKAASHCILLVLHSSQFQKMLNQFPGFKSILELELIQRGGD